MRRIWFVFLLLLFVILVGCSTLPATMDEDSIIQQTVDVRVGATPSPVEVESSPTPTEKAKEEVMVTDSPGEGESYDKALEPLVNKAKEDLSNRLKVGVDQIIVVEAELVIWPDASLGCPQPDMVYIQVPEDGTLIRLAVADQVYEYHGGGWTDPFLCEEVIKQKPTSPKIDITKRTPPPRESGGE